MRTGTAVLRGADPILLDLDGTLTASGPGIANCARHALRTVGHPGLGEDALRGFVGPPLAESFATLAGLPADQVPTAVAAYRERYLRVGMFENEVYPGIPELLRDLAAAGRTLAVATSKVEAYAERVLAHFGLAPFFQVVVGSELDGRRTAKREVVAEALTRLAAFGDVRRAVMIGDRQFDVVGAQANGLPSVAVLWGYGSVQELNAAGATALVTDTVELAGLLLG